MIITYHFGHVQCIHTHTQPFNGPLSGTTQVSRYQKGKTNLDLLKQETVSGSGISWAICNSLQTDNYASTPSHSFLQAGCPYCRPNNSVKALKACSMHTKPQKSNTWLYWITDESYLHTTWRNTTGNRKNVTRHVLRCYTDMDQNNGHASLSVSTAICLRCKITI